MKRELNRREVMLLPTLLAGAGTTAAADAPAMQRVGIASLLGDSVRIYARENREALFKDVGMNQIVFDVAGGALRAAYPQVEIRNITAPSELDVDVQVAIGNDAGRRGTLPDWLLKGARDATLGHLLLVNSDIGPMEFRTGLSQVVGNGQVSGVGFWVGADYRWKNEETGVTFNGYLAPFVQLRITLLDLQGPRVLHTMRLSEGHVTGPSKSEAPEPWLFLDRQQKTAALQALLRRNTARGVQAALQAVPRS